MENNLRCIKTHLKMHLKTHQNVSASEVKSESHTLANTQLLEFTWQPQFNVQMKELGENQAKSMQILARGRRDLAG